MRKNGEFHRDLQSDFTFACVPLEAVEDLDRV